jgi:replicative DNA helicase
MERVHLRFDSNALSSDLIKWIYDKAVELYTSDSVILDNATFGHLLDVEHRKRMLLTTMWKKIRRLRNSVTTASTLAAMKKLKTYYQARNISLCVNDAIKSLTRGVEGGDLKHIDDARKLISYYNDFLSTQDVHVEAGDPRDTYKTFKQHFIKIQKHPELMGGVPTGIKGIDDQLMGLRKSEFGLIAGPTGSGKSILMMDIGTYGWERMGDVIIVTIEMPKEQYDMRWYCRLSGINYENFRKYALTKDQWNHLDKTIEKVRKNKNKFIVIDMPEGCTMSAVKAEINSHMRHANVQEILIDYINIMTGPSGKVSMDWNNQLELAVEMKLTIARGLNVPTWTVAQTDGDKDTAFSKHIKDQLDVGILIKPDEDSKETGVVWLEWFKTRDFRGRGFGLKTSLDKMRFSEVPVEERQEYERVNQKVVKKVKI